MNEQSLEARFWAHVDKNGSGGCWRWTGYKTRDGYGVFTGDVSEKLTHRISLYWNAGGADIPKGMLVCHRCDVRDCVNPAHLFLGTYADNYNDMVSNGRRGKKRKKQFRALSRRKAELSTG